MMFGRTRPEAQVMIRMVMPRRPAGRTAGMAAPAAPYEYRAPGRHRSPRTPDRRE